MTRRNDIEFARENRAFFADLPPYNELADLWERYSRAVGTVQLHAQKIAGRKIMPVIFDLSAVEPPLELPVINFNRLNVPSDIQVPRVIGNAVENAKVQLKDLGLEAENAPVAVAKDSNQPLNIVTAQDPREGTKVPLKTRVRITYNYVPSERFAWMKYDVRLLDRVRRGD